MASLFEKINLLLGATLNSLVNQAIRANSVAVLEEQIRRARETRDTLEQTIAEVIAEISIAKGKASELERAIKRLGADAQVLLGTNEMQAAVLVRQKLAKQDALEKTQANIKSQEGDLAKLRQAEGALEAKITELVTTRDNVQQALEIAATKKRVVHTIQDLTDVLEESGAAGVADWAERVKVEAGVRLDMTLEKSGNLLNPMADGRVLAELQRMREKAAS